MFANSAFCAFQLHSLSLLVVVSLSLILLLFVVQFDFFIPFFEQFVWRDCYAKTNIVAAYGHLYQRNIDIFVGALRSWTAFVFKPLKTHKNYQKIKHVQHVESQKCSVRYKVLPLPELECFYSSAMMLHPVQSRSKKKVAAGGCDLVVCTGSEFRYYGPLKGELYGRGIVKGA